MLVRPDGGPGAEEAKAYVLKEGLLEVIIDVQITPIRSARNVIPVCLPYAPAGLERREGGIIKSQNNMNKPQTQMKM